MRLIIKDTTTHREIHPSKVNAQHFVLNVDLYKGDGTAAANLVRHASNAPSVSISMAHTTSFPPAPEQHMGWMVSANGQHVPVVHPSYGSPGYPAQPHAQGMYAPGYGYPPAPAPPQAYGTQQGHYTRNLIGSVAVSASLLEDTEKNTGLWFVLQDLSVRQEGTFRLKLSFVDVSELGAMLANGTASGEDAEENQGASPGSEAGSRERNTNKLATQSSPVLATCFSDAFQVHSAKKFPGVKESTLLSKCFAQQGVKIPIRKEGKNAKDEDEED